MPQRNSPTQRGATKKADDKDEDEKDGDKESLFSREDPAGDETGLDGDASDTESDETDDENKVVVVVKSQRQRWPG
jgi:hypothetical protein